MQSSDTKLIAYLLCFAQLVLKRFVAVVKKVSENNAFIVLWRKVGGEIFRPDVFLINNNFEVDN